MTTTTPQAGAGLPPIGQPVIRAFRPGVELRAASTAGGMPTMFGHFAVFDRLTEIDSWFEGHFMERIAPGAFAKTFREQTPKVLFQHGQDPQIGDKPLGPVESLSEDETGAAYAVTLLDTAYNRELVPGLEAGLYGASFRFKVMREEIVDEPGASDANPNGLPERTIKEAQVMEFGPVTFPAYVDATAGVRSLTDRFLFDAIERNPTRGGELLRQSLSRADMPSVSLLTEMYALGQQFVEIENDPEDAVDRDQMAQVLEMIEALVEVESQEDPAGRSKSGRTLPLSTPSTAGTRAESSRRSSADTSDAERRDTVQTWAAVLSEQEERDVWIPRI